MPRIVPDFLKINKKPPVFRETGGLVTPSSGLEPEFQEPESCVLSVALRGQKILATFILYVISIAFASLKLG